MFAIQGALRTGNVAFAVDDKGILPIAHGALNAIAVDGRVTIL